MFLHSPFKKKLLFTNVASKTHFCRFIVFLHMLQFFKKLHSQRSQHFFILIDPGFFNLSSTGVFCLILDILIYFFRNKPSSKLIIFSFPMEPFLSIVYTWLTSFSIISVWLFAQFQEIQCSRCCLYPLLSNLLLLFLDLPLLHAGQVCW